MKKINRWVDLAVVIVVIAIFSVGLYINKNKSTTNNSHTNMLNKTVTNNKVSFMVTKSQCGIRKIGSGSKYLMPTGQFCIVSLDIKNNNNKSISLKPTLQLAVDKNDQKYSSNAGAMYYLNNQSLNKSIKPHDNTSGQIVFDIPKNQTITAYQFTSSDPAVSVKISVK